VIAKEKNAHLIRVPGPIYAEGRCTGQSLKYEARIKYAITNNWSLSLIADHLYIRTSGEQENTIYGGSTWDSDFWVTDEFSLTKTIQSYYLMDVTHPVLPISL